MGVSLEDLDDLLNSNTLDVLGDTLTYTPAGGSPLTFKGIVDYGDGERSFGSSQVQGQDIAIEVPVATVPVVSNADVAFLPRTGLNYNPKQFLRDETGMSWLILLKRKVP